MPYSDATTIYEKTFDAEHPYQYKVGVYEKDGVRYFQVLKVIWAKAWILTLTKDNSEVLAAIAEAIELVQNP